jgi:hypothetical protein
MFIRALFSSLLFLILSVSNIFAQSPEKTEVAATDGSENFEINLNSTYTITATGKTIVEQKFLIKNKSPELFVSKYGIVVSSTNISNVEVSNNGKTIESLISKQKGQTSIGVTFDEKMVGEGKTNELVIRYSDSDVALISGKILEVNIPKLSDHYQYKNYQLELRVPSIFNTPSRINPSNFVLKQDGDYNVITYSNLQDQSVSAIFGNQQVFDLKLNYYLDNPTSQNALTQITLPPETSYQKVYYINLDPMPNNIKEDKDGNFIATYEIPANNSFNVELFAQVMSTLSADPLVPSSPIIPEYLSEQKFWETKNPRIVTASQNLSSVKSIYNFTVKELNYTKKPLTENFERLGAVNSLQEANKNDATCQEFADLFIALARTKNIPTRRLVGMAYSNNEELRPSNLTADILHTWPEYYDSEKNSWIQIDPTWEDTTGGVDYFNNFDLNHITFAINGISSTLPYPAGSYSGNKEEKNKKVYLDFSKEEFAQINPDIEVNLISQKIYGLTLPGNYNIEIFNKTGRVWYFSDIQVNSDDAEIVIDQSSKIQKILPFSRIVLPITVYNKSGNIGQKAKIKVTSILKEGQSTSDEFEVSSNFKLQINDPKKLIFLGGGLIVFTLLTGSLFILGRKLTNSLRRKGQKLEEESHKLQEISTALKENQENDGTGPQSGVPGPR